MESPNRTATHSEHPCDECMWFCHAQQLEEEKVHSIAEIEKLKHQIQSVGDEAQKVRKEWESKISVLEQENRNVQDENRTLSSRLNRANQDMDIDFGMSAVATKFYREEAIHDFVSLSDDIHHWVLDVIAPHSWTIQDRLNMLQRARASGVDVHSKLHNNQAFGNGDFISAYRFPKSDWHILVAMVFHFVEHHILSPRIYSGNRMHEQLNVITGLEMMILTKPGEKSYPYHTSQWAKRAISALLETTQSDQDHFSHQITDCMMEELCLRVFTKDEDSERELRNSLRKQVILPAIALQNKIMCAQSCYSLRFDALLPSANSASDSFIQNLSNLECKNLGKGPPTFNRDWLEENLSDDEIKKRLRKVGCMAPALVLEEFVEEGLCEPELLVKERVLVAWDQIEDPSLSREEGGFYWLVHAEHESECDASPSSKGVE